MVHLCDGFRLGKRPGTSPRKSADSAPLVVFGGCPERQRELCFDFVRGMMILWVFVIHVSLNGGICNYGLFYFGIHRPILNFAFDPLFNRIFASSGTSLYFVTAIIFLLLAGSLCVRIWKRIGISSERRMMPS